VAFLPCGKRLLSCSDDQFLQVLDISTGRAIFSIDTGEPLRAVVSNGANSAFAGGEGGYLRQFDMLLGQEEVNRSIDAQDRKRRSPHKGAITCLDVDCDRQQVLSGSDDAVVALWRVEK
jgi:WD40 repeat protein